MITRKNTSLAAPGALAHRLQCRTARKANEANLDPPNQKSEITSVESSGRPEELSLNKFFDPNTLCGEVAMEKILAKKL